MTHVVVVVVVTLVAQSHPRVLGNMERAWPTAFAHGNPASPRFHERLQLNGAELDARRAASHKGVVVCTTGRRRVSRSRQRSSLVSRSTASYSRRGLANAGQGQGM